MSQGKRKQVPCVLGQAWETYHYATGPTCPAPTVVRVCGESRPWARSDGSERHLARAIMGAYGYKNLHARLLPLLPPVRLLEKRGSAGSYAYARRG